MTMACYNKKQLVEPSKNWVTWGGGTNFLLERGNSPKKGEEVDLEMGGWHFFITLQFSCIYCVCREKVNFPLLHSDSSFFWINHARFSSKSL